MPGLDSAERRSFPFGCDARLKLCAALLAWLCVLSAASPAAPLWVAGCVVTALCALGIPLGRVLRPLAAGLFSACVAVLASVLLTQAEPHFTLSFAGYQLSLSESGWRAAQLLAARILGAVAVAAWLTTTTPWLELERALGWLRVPPALLDILSLARRYISVLRESRDTAHSAQALRLGYRGFQRSLRSAGALSGLTLARALDQAAATTEAMQLRGVSLPRTRPEWSADSHGNRRFAALSAAVIGASVLLSRGVPW